MSPVSSQRWQEEAGGSESVAGDVMTAAEVRGMQGGVREPRNAGGF